MLKFLTHKLRTHSLNEENVSEKVEERDSGTESDDEAERADTGEYCADVIMKWNDVTDISMGGEACACAPVPPRPLVAPEPDQLYDHHSSEEELEVINGSPAGASAVAARGEGRRRGASSPARTAPEKRRWPAEPYLDDELTARAPSSDDDDTKVETPVRFRTSPPLEAPPPPAAAAAPPPARARLRQDAAAEGGRRRRAVVARGGRRARRRAVRVLLVMAPALSQERVAERSGVRPDVFTLHYHYPLSAIRKRFRCLPPRALGLLRLRSDSLGCVRNRSATLRCWSSFRCTQIMIKVQTY